MSVTIECYEFFCVSVHEFCWVTLRVTDESDNHTISNTIKYYWFDYVWVFNEMLRLVIIDLIATEYYSLYTLVMLSLWQRTFVKNGRMYLSIYLLVSSVVLIVYASVFVIPQRWSAVEKSRKLRWSNEKPVTWTCGCIAADEKSRMGRHWEIRLSFS